MSSRSENLASIKACGVVAVLRADRPDALVQVAQAIGKGGIGAVEITMTTPGALEVIGECANRLGDEILLGAGTVLDPETARSAILAGAEYIVTPTLNPAVITLCRRYDKVIIPGALTPTEILTAWECGADIVKVPWLEVLEICRVGPRYFKDVKAPLPQIDLIPTGGVDLDNAGDFIRAGACAVAVGGNLVDKAAVAAGEWHVLTDTARKYVETVRNARQEGGG